MNRRKFLKSLLVGTTTLLLPVKAIASLLPKPKYPLRVYYDTDQLKPNSCFENEMVAILVEEIRKDIDNELIRRIN